MAIKQADRLVRFLPPLPRFLPVSFSGAVYSRPVKRFVDPIAPFKYTASGREVLLEMYRKGEMNISCLKFIRTKESLLSLSRVGIN